MSIHDWDQQGLANWRTNYASLAYSDDGNDFTRVSYLAWENNADNTDRSSKAASANPPSANYGAASGRWRT